MVSECVKVKVSLTRALCTSGSTLTSPGEPDVSTSHLFTPQVQTVAPNEPDTLLLYESGGKQEKPLIPLTERKTENLIPSPQMMFKSLFFHVYVIYIS